MGVDRASKCGAEDRGERLTRSERAQGAVTDDAGCEVAQTQQEDEMKVKQRAEAETEEVRDEPAVIGV
ncbi:hypothetical protein PHISP_03193 [Aspergillus sp. HF37]|nr:hypothetical protein PHISP_03193 [Aspergillus sp. HF37]